MSPRDRVTEGTASTLRQRTRMFMQLYRVGPRSISPWVRNALFARLPGGGAMPVQR